MVTFENELKSANDADILAWYYNFMGVRNSMLKALKFNGTGVAYVGMEPDYGVCIYHLSYLRRLAKLLHATVVITPQKDGNYFYDVVASFTCDGVEFHTYCTVKEVAHYE